MNSSNWTQKKHNSLGKADCFLKNKWYIEHIFDTLQKKTNAHTL